MIKALISALALPLLLASCAPKLSEISAESELVFEVRGELTAVSSGRRGRAMFTWYRTEKEDELSDRLYLMSPQGSVLAQIESSQGEYTLRTADGQRAEGDEIDAMIEARLGWPVPMPTMLYWLIGKSDPDESSRTAIRPGGLAKTIRQRGWRIDYLARNEDKLPQLIFVTKGDFRMEINISSWRAGEKEEEKEEG